LRGGTGNDRYGVLSGRGNQFLGGPGSDLFHIETRGSGKLSDDFVRTLEGRARFSSIDRADFLLQPDQPSATLDARGFSGDVWLRGQSGDDVLLAGSGNDRIDASWGNDRLVGGAGRDRLDGLDGIDTCDGGPGRDRVINCEVG
jgi:Ca2+-binding RTX toxin-like protein